MSRTGDICTIRKSDSGHTPESHPNNARYGFARRLVTGSYERDRVWPPLTEGRAGKSGGHAAVVKRRMSVWCGVGSGNVPTGARARSGDVLAASLLCFASSSSSPMTPRAWTLASVSICQLCVRVLLFARPENRLSPSGEPNGELSREPSRRNACLARTEERA